MMNRAWLPRAAAAGVVLVTAVTVGCGSKPKPQVPAAPSSVTPAAPARSADSAFRSDYGSDRGLSAALPRGREPAQARSSGQGDGSSSIARWRCSSSRRMALANGRPSPGALRSTGRPDQCARGQRPRSGRRVRRKEVRAGVDRRDPEDRDLSQSRRLRPRPNEPSRRTLRPTSTTCRFPKTSACWATWSFSGTAARLHP